MMFLFCRCQCPPQYEGPECQQTKHSFHGNGYAWFPPIRPCFESHLSLEFITEVSDGLLLYGGPMAQLQAWDPEDFIAIGTGRRKRTLAVRTGPADTGPVNRKSVVQMTRDGQYI